MEFTFVRVMELSAVGLLAGVVGGLLGIGGGAVIVPGLRLVTGKDQHLCQASAMIVEFFVSAPAALRHYMAAAVLKPVVRWTVPMAVAGVIIGVAASNMSVFRGDGSVYLARAFAVFLTYVTGYNVYRLVRMNYRLPPMDHESALRLPVPTVATVGLLTGFMSGLLGIGGGVLAVPAQQLFLRVPLKNAIANSACTIALSTLIGAAYKNGTLYMHGGGLGDSIRIALAVIPAAFVGAWTGAHLTHRLPRQPVRAIFIVILIAAMWKMWAR